MGEIETDKQQGDSAETTVEEETTTSKTDSGADDDAEAGDDADDNNDDGSTDEEETDDDEDETDDKKSKKSTAKDDKKGEEDDDKEPPTRKRPSDYARERIERKNSKKGAGKDDKTSEDDEDEDDIDPEDEKTVGKVVAKALKPFLEKEAKAQDDQEIKTFLTDNPDFKPYEAKARKYMAHPSRKHVPIEEIFYGVAGKDLMAIGAKRAKIADNEAKKTKGAGGSDDAGGVKSNASLSREELAAKQNEVRTKMAERY